MKRNIRSTTIIALKKDDKTAIAGDGQVTLGNAVIMKSDAQKIKTFDIHDNKIITGFAGATADAFALLDKFEKHAKEKKGDVLRACYEFAKDWRTDKFLKKLEAMLLVADKDNILLLSGTGDIIKPTKDKNVIAIGSGGQYAYAAALAYLDSKVDLSAKEIVKKSLEVASSICVYTNDSIIVEEI